MVSLHASARVLACAGAMVSVVLLASTAAAQSTPTQPPSAPPPDESSVQPLPRPYMTQPDGVLGPRVIRDYEEGDPIPAGYRPQSQTRTGLIVGGAVTLGTLWLLTALTGAAISDVNRDSSGALLYVPVFGPFLQMTKTDSSSASVILVVDGLAQAAGATMLIAGITSPRTVLIRNDVGEVRVAPMRLGQDGNGLGLVGKF